MRHFIILLFQSLWMRDRYIRFRTFHKWPASIVSVGGHLRQQFRVRDQL